MCISQLLDFPRLRLCGEFIRHCGHKTTQCRNYHHHALLRRSLKASSKHHDKRVLPRLYTPAVHRSVQHHQQRRRTHPRTAPPCTRLHHSCQRAAQRIRTLTTSVEQAMLATHNICRGPRLPQTLRQKERKMNGNHKQCRAPLSIMRPLYPLTMPFF
jgi:hypothetical protein